MLSYRAIALIPRARLVRFFCAVAAAARPFVLLCTRESICTPSVLIPCARGSGAESETASFSGVSPAAGDGGMIYLLKCLEKSGEMCVFIWV